MSEAPPEGTPSGEQNEATGTEETHTEQQQGTTEQRTNAEWAELRKAKKEADALRRQIKTFEDRDKTEAQKLEERAVAAEKRAAETEARALLLEVAAEKGLSPRQRKYLTGATRKELEANADELLEDFADKGNAAPAFNGGVRKTAEAPASMNDLIRSRAGRG